MRIEPGHEMWEKLNAMWLREKGVTFEFQGQQWRRITKNDQVIYVRTGSAGLDSNYDQMSYKSR